MEALEKVIINHSSLERANIFEKLYEQVFPAVARFVSKMGGSLDDAKDIFQDALVIFYEKNADPDFTISISQEAYIMGISKHLWLRKLNKDNRHVQLDDYEKEISIPADYFPDHNSTLLLKFLERAGKKCMDLLRAFYYEKLSMKELAQTMGYSTERSATVQKYKCLEKVRDTIKQKSIGYEDFVE